MTTAAGAERFSITFLPSADEFLVIDRGAALFPGAAHLPDEEAVVRYCLNVIRDEAERTRIGNAHKAARAA